MQNEDFSARVKAAKEELAKSMSERMSQGAPVDHDKMKALAESAKEAAARETEESERKAVMTARAELFTLLLESKGRESEVLENILHPSAKTTDEKKEGRQENAANSTLGALTEEKDTRDGSTVYIVRASRETNQRIPYIKLQEKARQNGGYYSRYKGGYLFTSRDDAEKFNKDNSKQNNIRKEENNGNSIKTKPSGKRAEDRGASTQKGEPATNEKADTGGAEPASKRLESIDRETEEVNKELALLGYYEETDEGRAETRFKDDLTRLQHRIAKDLSLTEDTDLKGATVSRDRDGTLCGVTRLKVGQTGSLLTLSVEATERGDGKGGLELKDEMIEAVSLRNGACPSGIRSISTKITYQELIARLKEEKEVDAHLRARGATPTQTKGTERQQPLQMSFDFFAQEADNNEEDNTNIKNNKENGEREKTTDNQRDQGVPDGSTGGDSSKGQGTDTQQPATNTGGSGADGDGVPVGRDGGDGRGGDSGSIPGGGRGEGDHSVPQTDRRGEGDASGERPGDTGGQREVLDTHMGGKGGEKVPDRRRDGRRGGRDSVEEAQIPEGCNTGAFLYNGETERMTETERMEANVKALETLRTLDEENRKATDDEKRTLSRYTGFGGLRVGYEWEAVSDREKRLFKVCRYFDPEGNLGVLDNLRHTMLTAYYTPTDIASVINKVTEKEGFKGGLWLDPAVGSGRFEGTMPRQILEHTVIHGCEPDYITAKIARHLYPEARIEMNTLEGSDIRMGIYDVVSTNDPFSTTKVEDKLWRDNMTAVREAATRSLHSYFAVKKTEAARAGGLINFITTKAVMDSPASELTRRHIADTCEIIGAVRLPETAFKGDGTSVVTDVIYLRKFNSDEERQAFHDNKEYRKKILEPFLAKAEKEVLTESGESVKVQYNAYFEAHPECLIGEIGAGGQYRDDEFTLKDNNPETPLAKRLEEVSDRLLEERREKFGERIYTANGSNAYEAQEEIDETERPYTGQMKETLVSGNLVMQEGRVGILRIHEDRYGAKSAYFQENEVTRALDARQVSAYITLRDALTALIRAEVDSTGEDTQRLRMALHQAYQNYTDKYKRLFDLKSRPLKYDASASQVFALEKTRTLVISNEGAKVKRTKTEFDGMADIYNKDVLSNTVRAAEPKDAKEALQRSLSLYGEVDPTYLKEKLGEGWREQCGDMIFDDTDGRGFITAEKYLSGDVVEKLSKAREAAKDDLRYETNVKALEAVQPKKMEFGTFPAHMGARWIPVKVYNEFMADTFGIYSRYARSGISYFEPMAEYTFSWNPGEFSGKASNWSSGKKRCTEIFEAALTDKDLRIYFPHDRDEKPVLDKEATREANAKVADLKDEFENWLSSRLDMIEIVEAEYNRRFNRIVLPHWDGSHLDVPGLTGKTLYSHQKDAVWMLLNNKGGIIDHMVGAGKTLVMQTAIMEMRRTGIARKPMIIALKSTIEQMRQSFQSAFPTARILSPDEHDFEKGNRDRFFAQIAVNDYDCIIVSHEQFEKFNHTKEARLYSLNEEKAQLTACVTFMKGDGDRSQLSKRQLKNLEKRLKELEIEIEKETAAHEDSRFYFEQMGVDCLFVDESQQFKNLRYFTQYEGVAGLGDTKGSKRANNLLVACRHLQRMNGGDRGVVFLSGTTITNSLTEMYNIFNYLRPGKMRQMGLNTFDAWASTFARRTNEAEFGVTTELKEKVRFRKFEAVKELSALYNEIADVRNSSNLKLPRPAEDTHLVTIKPSKTILRINEEIIKMVKNKNGEFFNEPGDEKTPWSLVATNIGKKLTVSPKLIDEKYDDDRGKIFHLCENIRSIYDRFNEDKGVQLIFCDTGVRNKNGEYNAYDDIIGRLTAEYGIPESEIVDIHTAKNDRDKAALFDRVNRGEVRVLIGGTKNMGTGVNVQERVVAMHHVDIPWTPSDVEQRNGRGVRQGNLLAAKANGNKVEIYYYAVERTLDTYRYQLQKTKGEMINRFKTTAAKMDTFDEDESEDETGRLDPTVMVSILSGNPVILEKKRMDDYVENLERRKRGFVRDQTQKKQNHRALTERKENFQRLVKENAADVKRLESHGFKKDEKGEWPAVKADIIYGYSERETVEGATEIGDKLQKAILSGKNIRLEAHGVSARIEHMPYLSPEGKHLYEMTLYADSSIPYKQTLPSTAMGWGMAMHNLMKKVISNQETYAKELDATIHHLEGASEGNDTFPQEEELKEAKIKQAEINERYDALIKKDDEQEGKKTEDETDPEEEENEDEEGEEMGRNMGGGARLSDPYIENLLSERGSVVREGGEGSLITDEKRREGKSVGYIAIGRHTQTGETLYIVKKTKYVTRDEFLKLCERAKAHGGHYSSFRENQGFIFLRREDATAFNDLETNENTQQTQNLEQDGTNGTSVPTLEQMEQTEQNGTNGTSVPTLEQTEQTEQDGTNDEFVPTPEQKGDRGEEEELVNTEARGDSHRIQDFGEKIAGARKDMYSTDVEMLDNVNEKALAENTFSKVFREPDVKKLYDEGVLSADDALWTEAMLQDIKREKKPAKKKYYNSEINQWAKRTSKKIEALRDFLKADAETRESVKDGIRERDHFPAYDGDTLYFSVRILEEMGYEPGDSIDTMKFETQKYQSVITVTNRSTMTNFIRTEDLDTAAKATAEAIRLHRGETEGVRANPALIRTRATRNLYRDNEKEFHIAYFTGARYHSETANSREEAQKKVDTLKNRGITAVMQPEREFVRKTDYQLYYLDPIDSKEYILSEELFDTKEAAEAKAAEMDTDAIVKRQIAERIEGEKKTDEAEQMKTDEPKKKKLPHIGFYSFPYKIEENGQKTYGKRTPTIAVLEKNSPTGEDYIFRQFDTEAEGWKYYKDHLEDMQKEIEDILEAAGPKKLTFFRPNEPRAGEDYRKEEDITPEKLSETFGLRGVQFGNWAGDADRQRALNETYDALLDLCGETGLEPRMIGLAGELGMAFGARGTGGFNAHYEPVQVVINLTKTKGAGSLAHEWMHAVDNFLSRHDGDAIGMISDKAKKKSYGSGYREDLAAAQKISNKIEDSNYTRRCHRYGDYWNRPHEKWARLFAEWVCHRIEEKGGSSHFLSRGVDASLFDRMKDTNYELYLRKTERQGTRPLTKEEFLKTEEAMSIGLPYPDKKEALDYTEEFQKFFSGVRARIEQVEQMKEQRKETLTAEKEMEKIAGSGSMTLGGRSIAYHSFNYYVDPEDAKEEYEMRKEAERSRYSEQTDNITIEKTGKTLDERIKETFGDEDAVMYAPLSQEDFEQLRRDSYRITARHHLTLTAPRPSDETPVILKVTIHKEDLAERILGIDNAGIVRVREARGEELSLHALRQSGEPTHIEPKLRFQRTDLKGRHATIEETEAMIRAIERTFPREVAGKVRLVSHEEFEKRMTELYTDTEKLTAVTDTDGTVYIDRDRARIDTPLHELGIHRMMDIAHEYGIHEIEEAILTYGATAPTPIKQEVERLYPEIGTDNNLYYEECAAMAFGLQQKGKIERYLRTETDKSWMERLTDTVKRGLRVMRDTVLGKRYASLTPLKCLEGLSYEKLGDHLFNLVMGGKRLDIRGRQRREAKAELRAQIIGLKGAERLALTDKADEAVLPAGLTLRESLSRLKTMTLGGEKDKVELSLATGFMFNTIDGKAKVEIMDEGLKVKGGELLRLCDGETEHHLSEFIADDTALMTAYPELKDVRIVAMVSERTRNTFANITEQRDEDGRTSHRISVFCATEAELAENIAHEIQHCIQRYEGFDEGYPFTTRLNHTEMEILKKILETKTGEQIRQLARLGEKSLAALGVRRKCAETVRKMLSEGKKECRRMLSKIEERVDAYASCAGENEAIAAAKRYFLSREERLRRKVSRDYLTPTENQKHSPINEFRQNIQMENLLKPTLSFRELRERIPIIEIAEYYGYTRVRGEGTRVPVLEHPSGDRIAIMRPQDAANQGYFNIHDNADSGALYQFIASRVSMGIIPNPLSYPLSENKSYVVNRVAHDYLHIPMKEREEVKKMISYAKCDSTQNDGKDFRAYTKEASNTAFLESRGLGAEIEEQAFKGCVLSLDNESLQKDGISAAAETTVAFPYMSAEGVMTAIEKRDTDLKSFVRGSRKAEGIWHSAIPEKIEKVRLFETPVDAMSHHALMREERTLYVATGGNVCQGQIEELQKLLRKHRDCLSDGWTLHLCYDNDRAGAGFALDTVLAEIRRNGGVTEQLGVRDGKTQMAISFTDKETKERVEAGIRNRAEVYKGSGAEVELAELKDEMKNTLVVRYNHGDQFSLSALTDTLTETCCLDNIRRDLPLLKDFNEDLMALRYINSSEEKAVFSYEEMVINKELFMADIEAFKKESKGKTKAEERRSRLGQYYERNKGNYEKRECKVKLP